MEIPIVPVFSSHINSVQIMNRAALEAVKSATADARFPWVPAAASRRAAQPIPVVA